MRCKTPRFYRRGSLRPDVAMGVLLILATITVGWWWLSSPRQPGEDEGRKVAEEFLGRIREGHPDQAWDATTAEFKSARGKEAFVRELKPLKALKNPLTFDSLQRVTVGNEQRSEYAFRTDSGGMVRIVLAREGSQWKVDRWAR